MGIGGEEWRGVEWVVVVVAWLSRLGLGLGLGRPNN